MTRLIILLGAPPPSSLDWDECHFLHHHDHNNTFTKQARAISRQGRYSASPSPPPTTAAGMYTAQWRLLPALAGGAAAAGGGGGGRGGGAPSGGKGKKGWVDGFTAPRGEALFFTAEDLGPVGGRSSAGVSEEVNLSVATSSSSFASTAATAVLPERLEDFYDHSLAVHEDLSSSQLPSGLESSEEESFSTTMNTTIRLNDCSNVTADESLAEPTHRLSSTPLDAPVGIRERGSGGGGGGGGGAQHLSDLEDIPNAAYLRSIEPQTMTVNLIVAIISIPPPRTVVTGRRWGRESTSELVELLVSDETKSGFGVTMWLSSPSSAVVQNEAGGMDGRAAAAAGGEAGGREKESSLRNTLKRIRPRDVVLIRNVALSTWQGRVHGQSLRGERTRLDLLYRRRLDRGDEDNGFRGFYSAQAVQSATSAARDPQLMKVKRVWDWMVHFVGEQKQQQQQGDMMRLLPPDTQ